MGCTSYLIKGKDLMGSVSFPFVVSGKAFGTKESGTLFTVAICISVVTIIARDVC